MWQTGGTLGYSDDLQDTTDLFPISDAYAAGDIVGTRADLVRSRPALEQLLQELRKDDILVVSRLDRLARSTAELLRIAEVIRAKDAGLQSLEEPWADTTTPAGRMVLTMFAGVAEFERALIRHRTDEGRQAAASTSIAPSIR